MAEKPEEPKKTVRLPKGNTEPIGDAGLNELALNTNFTTEYLTELQGRQGSLNYQKMAKSDTQTGMILSVYKNPIKSANWTIPDVDDATDSEKKAIEICRDWFFERYEVDFYSQLSGILSCLEYGFSAFEQYYRLVQYSGGKYFMPVLEQRMQTSIENIYPDKGIVQQITIKRGLVDIPMDNMVFFTLNRSGMDYRGEPILRNGYSAWKNKNYYEQNLGMGINRNAAGVPHMEIPEGTDPESDDYIATESLLKNMTMHENAYMITPKGYTFLLHESKFKPKEVMDVIQAYDTMIAVSTLSQFMLLGQGDKGGAYALSRDQSDLFLDALNYIVYFIEKCFHRQIIIPFLNINFGDSVDASKVRLRGLNLNKKAGNELADVLMKLTPQGYITPTIDDEITLRKNLEMPDLSENQIQKRRAKEEEEEPVKQEINVDNIKLAENRNDERKKILDREIKNIHDVMKANLYLIKDKFVADIRKTMNKGSVEIKGLRSIEISSTKYRTALEKKLAWLANMGWNRAKKQAKKNNVKLSEEIIKMAEDFNPQNLTDKELKEYILNEATLLTDDQVQSMSSRAIATASSGPIKGLSVNQTIANVEKVIEDFIEGQKVSTGAGLAVVGSINFGEAKFNKQISDKLWGYRFVAVDDNNTTQICSSYSGKTFSVDSIEMSDAAPPLHPNCRSHLEPIYKTSEEKPEIDDYVPPPSIRKQKSVY